MRTFKETACVVVATAALGVAWPAQAGPDFAEGMCTGAAAALVEAGGLPGTSCPVTGPGGNVATISGNLAGPIAAGPSDFEDMYLVLITDPKNFSATTVGADTGFDTQLWLFQADPDAPGGALDGFGLLGNNDISAVDDASLLESMSSEGPPGMCPGVVPPISIMTPGLYYLAISGGGGLGDPDGRFPVASGLAIFCLELPTEISGPDGPGGCVPPLCMPPITGLIDGWGGDGETGSYVIAVEGVSFIEEPCPWDCEAMPDGSVGITDFLDLLAQWMLIGAPCDFDGGGVGIVDFLKLLANWGPCSK